MKRPHKAKKKPHKARRAVKPPRRGAKGPVKGSKQPPKGDRRLERIPNRPDLVGIRVVSEDDGGKHKGKVIAADGGLVVIQRDDDPAPSRLDYVQLDRFEDEHPKPINMRCGTWRHRAAV